jgi:hypothetical protein
MLADSSVQFDSPSENPRFAPAWAPSFHEAGAKARRYLAFAILSKLERYPCSVCRSSLPVSAYVPPRAARTLDGNAGGR